MGKPALEKGRIHRECASARCKIVPRGCETDNVEKLSQFTMAANLSFWFRRPHGRAQRQTEMTSGSINDEDVDGSCRVKTMRDGSVVTRAVESPCPSFMGRISRKSSTREHGGAFLRDLVSSLLDRADADPQNTLRSHTLLLKTRGRNKMRRLGARVNKRTGKQPQILLG